MPAEPNVRFRPANCRNRLALPGAVLAKPRFGLVLCGSVSPLHHSLGFAPAMPMNPLNLFKKRSENSKAAPGHMTWASGTVSHRISQTRYFLRRQLWIWPIIAVLVLGVLGVSLRYSIESTIKRNLASGLQTVLELETEMLMNWFQHEQEQATTIANDRVIREAFARTLLPSASNEDGAQRNDLPTLNELMLPRLSSHTYVGYFATDKNGRVVSTSHDSLLGQRDIPEYNRFLSKVYDGASSVSVPFPSVVVMKTESGRMQTGQPTMYVAVPVRDDSYHVIGALALQVRPERDFTSILQFGRVGDSGETYAFDENGVLVSNSRFDDDLILLGILPDEDDSKSLLNVHVRDPGGDMTEGFRPTARRAQRPLTVMAARAISGDSGVDVEGYRDYRGVPVVGAWTWLPEYRMGIAAEVDVAQAFRPIVILQRAFWTLFTLLALTSVAIFVFTLMVARLKRDARKAAIEAQQLGQYSLEEKLGAGAMGVVYKGRHSMLRRETAIKLLNADRVNSDTIARFEREVQMTCRLNHPNTIAIYDYGRTPEGVFYYAMEYLNGIDLQSLVKLCGPLPEGRVIHILKQICGSLYEAHSLGLVHRDVKPANIVLSRRGGVPDVAKVLDFGLVRALDQDKESSMTATGALTGTPLYMSPEAIQNSGSVDGRSDLYAVGAVGYFLLTGQPVFAAESIVDLCQMHVNSAPLPPSEIDGLQVSRELEAALLSCLEKMPSARPQTARELIRLLEQSEASDGWAFEDADRWWDENVEQVTQAAAAPLETQEATVIASAADVFEQSVPTTRHPR